jgi:hypothetical protein
MSGRFCCRLAVITCLVSCIATALAWTLSYWRYDRIGTSTFNETGQSRTGYGVGSSRSRVILQWNKTTFPSPQVFRTAQEHHALLVERVGRLTIQSGHRPVELSGYYRGRPRKVRYGFMWDRRVAMTGPGESAHEYRSAMVPYWFLVLLTAIVPATWAGRRLGRRLRAHRFSTRGLCPACGYDLRATPGRCPELRDGP